MGTNDNSEAAMESLKTMMESLKTITPTLATLVQNMNELNAERATAKAEATAAAATAEVKAAAAVKEKDEHKKTLDHHFQKKIGKFDATAKGWSDWRFQVRTAAGSADTKLVEVLNAVEKLDGELTATEREEWDMKNNRSSEKGYHLKRWSAELYEALSLSAA